MRKFNTILIANRGEIAVRVIRTAKSLGYRTVAVYSEADARAVHVQLADNAFLLGPAPVGESYLNRQRILTAAAQTGADAIHPGYGFLSENAAFARAVEEAGLVFIGPTPKAIELMGNKAAAKRLMIEAGVPCVPGYQSQDQSDAALTAAAKRIGFPLMVKAAAGGGGRGMRLVHDTAALAGGIKSARSEALNAFGSDELILEKAILRPRHVEIQVFADSHGNVIHLGERDCSVQRRHQKVIEEAPCPVMTTELRAQMGASAIEAARSIGYRGAGTVEFLLDQSGAFYFLEMNTRIQVEHPVTEMITGLDLVALQIRVAQGETLPVSQHAVQLSGHAIEARLYAEDPSQGFLPVSGKIDQWVPAQGEGVRVDAGICGGQEVSPFYDPMIAKVIAWGEDRQTAIERLIGALSQTRLFGLTTNRSFLVDILQRDTFRQGQATTAFIAEEFGAHIGDAPVAARDAAIGATLQFLCDRQIAQARSLGCSDELLNWTSRGTSHSNYRYRDAQSVFALSVAPKGKDSYEVAGGQQVVKVQVAALDEGRAMLTVDGQRVVATFLAQPPGLLHLALGSRTLLLRNELAYPDIEAAGKGGGRITAPMHGVLLEVFVRPGDKVAKGARVAILEAMKMQHELRAEVAGEIASVAAAAGTQVAADDLLIEIKMEASP
jgi:geranyl-CoA carboxylase alpha subunit